MRDNNLKEKKPRIKSKEFKGKNEKLGRK